jgi:hypothetical protein
VLRDVRVQSDRLAAGCQLMRRESSRVSTIESAREIVASLRLTRHSRLWPIEIYAQRYIYPDRRLAPRVGNTRCETRNLQKI